MSTSHSASKTAQTTSSSITAAATSSTSSPTDSSTSSSSAVAAANTPSSTSHSDTLSSAEAVGVSIAAFAGMVLLIACIYGIAFFRRRKLKAQREEKHDSFDFIDEEPIRSSSFRHNAPTNSTAPFHGPAFSTSEVLNEKRDTAAWYQAQFPAPAQAASRDKSAWVSALGRSHSPLSRAPSNDSLRTVSQLLPEKPGSTPYTRQQPPARPRRSPRTSNVVAMSPATLFEEDRDTRVVSQTIPPLPNPPISTGRKLGLPGKDIRQPQFAPQYTCSPEDIRPPQLSLQIPQPAARPAQTLPNPHLTFPPPPLTPGSPPTDHTSLSSVARKSTTSTAAPSLLNYYTSSLSGSSNPSPSSNEDDQKSLISPVALEPQQRVPTKPQPGKADRPKPKQKQKPAAITTAKPVYPPRAVRSSSTRTGGTPIPGSRDSRASDTSFESTDPDEPTPPDEEKPNQLSPVAETAQSPVAHIRYPKIPRSSNQSIPRSPPILSSPSQHKVKNTETASPVHARAREQHNTASPRTPQRPPPVFPGGELSGTTQVSTTKPRPTQQEKTPNPETPTPSLPHKSNPQIPPTVPASSPLKSYGRRSTRKPPPSLTLHSTPTPTPTSNRQKTPRSPDSSGQEVWQRRSGLESPLWKPKLTPRRRGEDLFLEVGVVSPGLRDVDGGWRGGGLGAGARKEGKDRDGRKTRYQGGGSLGDLSTWSTLS
ncbi:hypothetical protein B0A50_08234 [Salinomyces thailandicus]|uniref:Uncharacterized protein n=1 Tax=Salinomyces thailandicus TaxID=706561 RepID=A0A4U0TKP0_9PEZI|nr:hypothetical protein B0A50_08234 [Salinomyces thailandica]